MTKKPPQKVTCTIRYRQQSLMWQVITVQDGKQLSIGRYETKESAEAARTLVKHALQTATSKAEADRQIQEIEKLSDITYPQTFLDVPKRYAHRCSYKEYSGCYEARISMNGRAYSLGAYSPYELDIAEQRLKYMTSLAEASWSVDATIQIERLFRRVQFSELTTLKSVKTRLAYANTRLLAICATNDDGKILTNTNENIDTIRLYDVGLLSDADLQEYQNVLFYNMRDWAYLTSPVARNLAWNCKKSVHIMRTIGKD